MRKMLVLAALMASLGGLCQAARAAGWNMPVGVTEVSRDVYGLHMVIFWICVIIGVIVFGVMFYSLFRYRRSKGAEAAHFHEHTTVEVVWTAIPFLILVAMAIPATATLKNMYDASEAELSRPPYAVDASRIPTCCFIDEISRAVGAAVVHDQHTPVVR